MIRLTLILLLVCGLAGAKDAGNQQGRRGGSKQPVQTSKCNDVPAHPFDLILGRPTTKSVTVSVLSYDDVEGWLAYGNESGKLDAQTTKRLFKKAEPAEIMLSSLGPDTRYYYQFHSARGNSAEFAFHTARPPDSPFTFTITADSHLDERTDVSIYQRSMASALDEKPDFHIDLGDTFMSEKHPDRESAAKQYLSQRFYFGQTCQSVPLFLVLGNHDGESPRGRGDTSDSLAVWSNMMRKRYFPNPVPDDFFTGNANKHPEAGLLQDYYAWQWGDAQFIVLDPFWFTQQQRGHKDNWSRTLGTNQYQWLKNTLESSKAKFKFIFIHHLVGGADDQCRGGSEAAPLYEWGGRNADGSDGFAKNRPGWAAPIHQLLLNNKVSIVFHGHDHFYAKQDLDGIVYQEVPQPGATGNARAPRSASEYGYKNGVILGGSGHLRVSVASTQTMVEYINTDQAIAHSYIVALHAANNKP